MAMSHILTAETRVSWSAALKNEHLAAHAVHLDRPRGSGDWPLREATPCPPEQTEAQEASTFTNGLESEMLPAAPGLSLSEDFAGFLDSSKMVEDVHSLFCGEMWIVLMTIGEDDEDHGCTNHRL